MPLKSLNLGSLNVKHLEHLKGMQRLDWLCLNHFVKDLTPLEGMDLKEIWLSPARIERGWTYSGP